MQNTANWPEEDADPFDDDGSDPPPKKNRCDASTAQEKALAEENAKLDTERKQLEADKWQWKKRN